MTVGTSVGKTMGPKNVNCGNRLTLRNMLEFVDVLVNELKAGGIAVKLVVGCSECGAEANGGGLFFIENEQIVCMWCHDITRS